MGTAHAVHPPPSYLERYFTQMSEKTVSTMDSLREVATFADAFAALKAAGVDVHVVNEFDLIEDKDSLIGVPLLIFGYAFHAGDFGKDGFVSVEAITEENRKIVFNDGSTGIRQQLRTLEDKGILTGIICKNGLRKSEYYFNAETGETNNHGGEGFSPASTYYLD